jgi:hypothetical protein
MTNIQITRDEERHLAQLHAAFMAKLNGLPEKRQRAVIHSTAGNVLWQDRGPVDPYTRALAKQMLEVFQINDRIGEAQAEIAQIEREAAGHRSQGDPTYRGQLLSRKADLEESIQQGLLRTIAIREDDLRGPRTDAVKHFRAEAAQAAKSRALIEAIERARAESEAHDVATRAREIVNAERQVAGKEPLSDEAQ